MGIAARAIGDVEDKRRKAVAVIAIFAPLVDKHLGARQPIVHR